MIRKRAACAHGNDIRNTEYRCHIRASVHQNRRSLIPVRHSIVLGAFVNFNNQSAVIGKMILLKRPSVPVIAKSADRRNADSFTDKPDSGMAETDKVINRHAGRLRIIDRDIRDLYGFARQVGYISDRTEYVRHAKLG